MSSHMSLIQRIRITLEYMRLFSKMIVSNKFSLVWYLIFPNVLFLFAHYNWLSTPPTKHFFLIQTSVFAAYIIFLLSIDAPLNLVRLRETGSLKVFTFISGSKHTIVLAQILTQMITMLFAILLFSLMAGILMLADWLDIVKFACMLILACLVTAPMLSIFFMWLMLLRVKQESLFTAISIILLVFFLVSANDFVVPTWLDPVILFVNPLELIRDIIYGLSSFIFQSPVHLQHPVLVAVIWIIYTCIGWISILNIPIHSAAQRT